MKKIKLTCAHAIVKYLISQKILIDGKKEPLFAGAFGIFGHGNVACLGQALEENKLAEWSEMLSLLAVIISNQGMHKLINNPKLSANKLYDLILDIYEENLSKTSKNFIKILRLLAVGYFANGQLDEGSAVSRKVLKHDSKCLSSIHNLALASLTNHRYRSAWGWVNRGLAIDAYDDELRRLKSRLIWAWVGKNIKKLTSKFSRN